MAFAFDVVDTVRAEEPDLFDAEMQRQVRDMLAEAVECEVQFAADLLEQGVSGMSLADMRAVPATRGRPAAGAARHRADVRPKNPFAFMELQDVQELSNFFERRVSAYQVGVTGRVAFDDDF